MKIAGIVAECNPLHKGHQHLMERMRDKAGECRADALVVLMSGDFVQRGEPALLGKAARTEMLLAAGADLVLELPLPYVLSSAEGFASGAMRIFHRLGCIEQIGFGSECGDVALLRRAAEQMENERFLQLMKYFMEEGISYPAARQKALAETVGHRYADLLTGANNVLGIEYLRAAAAIGSPITAFTVPRIGAEHDADIPIGDIAGASFLRRVIREGRVANAAPYVSGEVFRILSAAVVAGSCPADSRLLERAVLATLRQMPVERLAEVPGVSEGLENRFLNAIRQAGSLDELVSLTKTKRYPQTRIQRMIWNAFLGVERDMAKEDAPYVRLLGVGKRGHDVMNLMRKSDLPLLSRAVNLDRFEPRAKQWYDLACRAADLYALTLPKAAPCGGEQTYAVAHRY